NETGRRECCRRRDEDRSCGVLPFWETSAIMVCGERSLCNGAGRMHCTTAGSKDELILSVVGGPRELGADDYLDLTSPHVDFLQREGESREIVTAALADLLARRFPRCSHKPRQACHHW